MKIRSAIGIMFVILMILTFFVVIVEFDGVNVSAQNNRAPILENHSAYYYEEEKVYVFYVDYRDLDGDLGEVRLYINDGTPVKMGTAMIDPLVGQYYEIQIPEEGIDDYTEFYFEAEDSNGAVTILNDESDEPFLMGDFDGWGEPPILSNPGVYFNGDDWVFNVTYRDPDGDEANSVTLYLDDVDYGHMETVDPDPSIGQNFMILVLEQYANESTEFYFDADDEGGSYTYFSNGEDWFKVEDYLKQAPKNGGSGNNGDNGGGAGFTLPERWGDPEVIIGLIALIGMGVGSAVGLWVRKRKRSRFSELLTKLDDIYSSYKMNPTKCETELKKVRVVIKEDLKQNAIDENNYSILKDRIDEIVSEIRGATLHSQVEDLPKDIELRVKDMLIDGKINRKEYRKFMKALKGSAMASSDKKEMEKLLKVWMKEDSKNIK
jgi:hypothetical protein